MAAKTKKYHYNEDTGISSECEAKIKCRLGGEDMHGESKKEARQKYEKSMESSLFITHKAKPKRSADYVKAEAEYQTARNQVEELSEALAEREQTDPEYKGTDEWFNQVQQRKAAYFSMLVKRQVRQEVLPADIAAAEAEDERLAEEEKQGKKSSRPKPPAHPELTKNTGARARKVISTFSGLSEETIAERVQEKMDAGMGETEAHRAVWAETPMRKDKPIVSLDLEVAANTDGGRVDMGSRSNIIEVGYVKMYPDGRVEKKSYLCGVPDNFRETCGTGAEFVHHISPEMVQGKPIFVEDEERQKELMDDLRGCVLSAHNASYEKSQLSHNLRGFHTALNDGSIEVIDTRDVCSFFVPEAENNSNESFVEATGGKYEGAHRAYEDALMSLNATLRLRNMKTITLD